MGVGRALVRGGALVLAGLAGARLAAAARDWLDVVEVRGRSMSPTLQPGDRLLVERWTYERRSPLVGDVVLAADPRAPQRELIKRVTAVEDGRLTVRGDAPDASTDSRAFGDLRADTVRWRVAFRYWPPERAGLVTPRPDRG
jgi:nickel-type superoxide dismutase maturation protease